MFAKSRGLAVGCVSNKLQPLLNIQTEHVTNLQSCNCRKWFYNIFQRLVWKTRLFLLVHENIPHHRIVTNSNIKLEFKGILVFSLPSLIPLQFPPIKRRQVNGVRRRRRKRSQTPTSESQNTKQQLSTITIILYTFHQSLTAVDEFLLNDIRN